jgi:hypothetical protein
MFDINSILVYGWTWKYYDRNTDDMMRKVLKMKEEDENGEHEELEEMFQAFLYDKYNLIYGKAIPRRNGEDDVVCYVSFPVNNKESLLKAFSIPIEPLSPLLNHFNLTSPPEVYALVNVDF